MATFKPPESWIEHRAEGKDPKGVRFPVVANFWTGGAPEQYEIKSLNPSGAFIVTKERWYPGTVLRMTLEYDPRSAEVSGLGDRAHASVFVYAKVVRCWPLGVDVEFVYQSEEEIRRFEEFLAIGHAPAHEMVAG